MAVSYAKLIELKCKSCGSIIELESGQEVVVCKYCGTKFFVDDEVRHINYNNAEQTGYEFEKGRQKAQAERIGMYSNNTGNNQPSTPAKKRRTWLWVLGWVFIFPLPITILLLRKKEMKPALKYGIIAASWALYLIIGIAGVAKNSNVADDKEKDISASIADTSASITDSGQEDTPNKEFSLDGIENNSSSAFLKNEVLITRFICEVNAEGTTKISKVEFENNHTKAKLCLNNGPVYTVWDQVDNSNVDYDFGIEIGFNNGKATVDDYDTTISTMIHVFANDYDDEKIRSIISEAKESGCYSDKAIYLEYRYSENAVGYQQGDHYWIEIRAYNYR